MTCLPTSTYVYLRLQRLDVLRVRTGHRQPRSRGQEHHAHGLRQGERWVVKRDSYDVVRKGLVTTDGGDHKMEIKRKSKLDPSVGKLHCLFRGDRASVTRVARPDIVDGNWHTLQCVKTGNPVEAKVNGKSLTSTGSAGSLSNSMNVMVGGKTVDPRSDDVFDGSMDFVSIEIAQ